MGILYVPQQFGGNYGIYGNIRDAVQTSRQSNYIKTGSVGSGSSAIDTYKVWHADTPTNAHDLVYNRGYHENSIGNNGFNPFDMAKVYLMNRALGSLDWERTQYQLDYNAREAAKNRQWQEYMSNTSYQRGAADAMAAGYNPGLVMGQGGASTPSGSTAHANGSVVPAGRDFGKLLVDCFGTIGALVAAGMRSSAIEAAQDIRGQYTIDATKLRGNSALVVAKTAADARKYSADVASKASKFNAVRHTPEYFERANLSAERMAAHKYFKDVDANTMYKLYDLMKDPWGRVKVMQLYREWQDESK